MIIFLAEEKNVKLKYVINWLNMFIGYHNKKINIK